MLGALPVMLYTIVGRPTMQETPEGGQPHTEMDPNGLSSGRTTLGASNSQDFVALDLEFSGLFLDAAKSGKVLSYEDYFAKCAESAWDSFRRAGWVWWVGAVGGL